MTELPGTGLDAWTLLGVAARELLPVVVEMGPDQARFASFIASVAKEGEHAYAVLDPVAADALPPPGAPFRIVPADGVAGWVVTANRLEPDGPRRARVDLAGARILLEQPDKSHAVQITDLLVLVVPGGLDGSSSYVFPVQRIGADVCEVRTSVALAPGSEIERVEIVGDRRLLRRASAQVLRTVPYYLADGGRSFTSRLSLSDEPQVPLDQPHDLVTDSKEVRRLIELAGMLQTQGWYEAPGWGRGTLRLLEAGKDSLLVELGADLPAGDLTRRSIRMGFDVFAVPYELDVRGLAIEGGRLRAALPLILRRRRRHRRDHRVSVLPSHGVELSFRHPVTGAVSTHPVRELSFFGVCFECEPQASVLWKGLPLEQAQLTWGNRLVHLGDLGVEHYGYDQGTQAVRCVASIPQSNVADDPDMISLLATLAHPRVRAHDGRDFSALHRTYVKAGLFGPHMHRNLAPMLEQIEGVWRRLHSDASDVARTFVHGPENAPDAAVTIVRAWEHTWVPQHFVDISPDINGATGSLQTAYLDHLVPRRDGRYLVFFVKTDNSVMNAYLKRFFAGMGTPDAVARTTVELWSRPAGAAMVSTDSTGVTLRPCQAADEVVVARAAERALGSYAAAALSLVPGELSLPDSRERFGRAMLERSRECWLVTRGDEIAYAVLEERATPGVNLTWMLNSTWVVPVHPEIDRDGSLFDAALRSVVERPAQSATGERFLNLPEGLDHARLRTWGFTKEASVYLYALTRAGLHRFLSFAVNRYGEVDAMALRRERRRALSPRGT